MFSIFAIANISRYLNEIRMNEWYMSEHLSNKKAQPKIHKNRSHFKFKHFGDFIVLKPTFGIHGSLLIYFPFFFGDAKTQQPTPVYVYVIGFQARDNRCSAPKGVQRLHAILY